MSSEDNKRIAKNTIFLYLRMLVTVIVTLYTSRIILDTLGVDDYGIFNVVGGVVMMLGFITNTMASASQRFFAYELGQNNFEKLKKTFSTTFSIYLIFTVIVVVFGETIGLWFVQNKLTIPPERIEATFWVYQFTILTFIVTILRIPYNSLIIAHEKMSFYAWSSIIEVFLKLVIVFILVWFSFDKLILFGALTFVVAITVTVIYIVFCIVKFAESKYRFVWDRDLFKTMFGFASWNLFAASANVGMNEGVNVLLNIFFRPAINAARGIAFQISSQVIAFVGNFQMAASPQIIKYYASGNIDNMEKLYYQSSRLSYFLLYTISLPLLLETELLLGWWLKEVPEYTVLFTRLVIINRLVDCMSGTIIPVVQATGKIKFYQIFVGTTIILNVPISYILLKNGASPEITMYIMIALSSIALFVRLFVVRSLLGFKVKDYLNLVVKNNLLITIFSAIVPIMLYYYMRQNLISFFLIGTVSVIATLISIYLIGLNVNEKEKLLMFIKKYFKK